MRQGARRACVRGRRRRARAGARRIGGAQRSTSQRVLHLLPRHARRERAAREARLDLLADRARRRRRSTARRRRAVTMAKPRARRRQRAHAWSARCASARRWQRETRQRAVRRALQPRHAARLRAQRAVIAAAVVHARREQRSRALLCARVPRRSHSRCRQARAACREALRRDRRAAASAVAGARRGARASGAARSPRGAPRPTRSSRRIPALEPLRAARERLEARAPIGHDQLRRGGRCRRRAHRRRSPRW